MKGKTQGDHKIIVIPLKPQRELTPWQIDMQPHSSLLDPYKNLVSEKADKVEVSTHDNCDQMPTLLNFKSFLSNQSQLGDVPAEIPSYSQFHDDQENPEVAAFSTIAFNTKHSLQTEEDHIQIKGRFSKHKKQVQSRKAFFERQQQSKFRRIKNAKRVNGSPKIREPQIETTCKCKKSKCLKMYCQCFMNGNVCGIKCECIGCDNIPNSPPAKKRRGKKEQKTEQTVKEGKIEGSEGSQIGCSCRKTQCMKKYCECYNNGNACGFNCRCEGCLNQDQI